MIDREPYWLLNKNSMIKVAAGFILRIIRNLKVAATIFANIRVFAIRVCLRFYRKVLYLFRQVFFFPVGVDRYSNENKCGDNTNNKYKSEFIHYSPPLKYIPAPKNTTNKIPPIIAVVHENFSPSTKLPIIKVIKSICDRLKKTFAISSFCFLLSFISNINIKNNKFCQGENIVIARSPRVTESISRRYAVQRDSIGVGISIIFGRR